MRQSSQGGRLLLAKAAEGSRAPTAPDLPRQGSLGRSLGAVSADDLVTVSVSPARAVIDQETAGAGELVVLLGYHPHGEFLVGEVRARQLEVVQDVGLVDIDRCRPLLGTTSVELFDRLGCLLVGLSARERVVVGPHAAPSAGRSGNVPLVETPPAPSRRCARLDSAGNLTAISRRRSHQWERLGIDRTPLREVKQRTEPRRTVLPGG